MKTLLMFVLVLLVGCSGNTDFDIRLNSSEWECMETKPYSYTTVISNGRSGTMPIIHSGTRCTNYKRIENHE